MLPRPIIAIFIFSFCIYSLKVISNFLFIPSFIKYFDISSILHFTIVQTSTILFCDLFIRFDKHFY